jgi:hypothetical protein
MPANKKRARRGSANNQLPSSEDANPGKGIALYHEMRADEDFETTTDILFQLVRDAAKKFPGKPRYFYLDIEGHRNDAGGYDNDAFELLSSFLIGYLGQYLTRIPTIGGYATNPDQREDIPEHLIISSDVPKDGRQQMLLEQARDTNVPVFDADTGRMVLPDGTIREGSPSEDGG